MKTTKSVCKKRFENEAHNVFKEIKEKVNKTAWSFDDHKKLKSYNKVKSYPSEEIDGKVRKKELPKYVKAKKLNIKDDQLWWNTGENTITLKLNWLHVLTRPKHYNDFKAFIQYLNDMPNNYKNTEECNLGKKRKVLIVFDDMVADMIITNLIKL